MSKNISKLSGRVGLKNNLFQKISDHSLNKKNSKDIKEIANEYRMGVSTIHGAESFYEFLRPSHREKKGKISLTDKSLKSIQFFLLTLLIISLEMSF